MSNASHLRSKRARQRGRQVTFLLLLPIALVSGMACGLAVRDPVRRPAFLTPMAEATKAGLVPYWLGPEFHTRGKSFKVQGESGFNTSRQGGPGLVLSYYAREIGAILTLHTFASDATLNDSLRQQASRVIGGHSERVTVGSWEGELYTSPTATRPVNQLLLFLDVDGAPVIVAANAADSGVPGEDPNPLIDRDTLISTLAALRPYPQ